jgi:hypothetical protein
MNGIVNSIVTADLARIAAQNPQLGARGITEPNALADANFFLAHNGQTREQHAEGQRFRARQDFAARNVADLDDDPPSGLGGDIRGLSPARATFARYSAWLATEVEKLTKLETKRAELLGMIDATAETESRIQVAVRATADFLLGRTKDDGDQAHRKALDERLATQRHQSDAAKVALPEIERQIEVAEMRVNRLREREKDFLWPALIEVADLSGLGKQYAAKAQELAKLVELLFGLAYVAGNFWGSGLPRAHKVELPAFPGLPSIAKSEFNISASSANADPWSKLAAALTADPRCDATKHLKLKA